jgi:hypothetical protein
MEEGRKWGERVTASEWTCARCGVTVSFMPGVVHPRGLPDNWERVSGVPHCLNCLRKLAGEARSAALSEERSPLDRTRANAEGRIEFELLRAPDRADTRIARACGASVGVVKGVRERLAAYPTRPA